MSSLAPSPSSSIAPPRPSLLTLLRVWLLLGLQSFGGGSVTRYLIWQATVQRYGWLTDEEFTHYWAIVHVAPGINLLALTTLIGYRLAGVGGILACMFGLLFPSVTITIIFTALYSLVRESSLVQAALHGVVPATVGIGLILVIRLGQPLLAESRREGWASVLFAVVIFLAAVVLTATRWTDIIFILIGSGVLGAGVQGMRSRRNQ